MKMQMPSELFISENPCVSMMAVLIGKTIYVKFCHRLLQISRTERCKPVLSLKKKKKAEDMHWRLFKILLVDDFCVLPCGLKNPQKLQCVLFDVLGNGA